MVFPQIENKKTIVDYTLVVSIPTQFEECQHSVETHFHYHRSSVLQFSSSSSSERKRVRKPGRKKEKFGESRSDEQTSLPQHPTPKAKSISWMPIPKRNLYYNTFLCSVLFASMFVYGKRHNIKTTGIGFHDKEDLSIPYEFLM